MGTHVRLDESVYEKIAAQKREDETFSEAIDRLTSDWSLAEWGERYAIEQETAEHHLAVLDDLEETDRTNIEETLAMLDEAGE